MARLDSIVGEHKFDDIIAGTDPELHATVIKLAASTKAIKRGTVIAGTAGGNLKPVSEALTAASAVYVLAEDVDSATAGDTATAYKTGNFVLERLSTDGSYELKAADIELMRKSGLLTTGIFE